LFSELDDLSTLVCYLVSTGSIWIVDPGDDTSYDVMQTK